METPVKNPDALVPVLHKLSPAGLLAITHWLANHPVQQSEGLDLDFDFPAANV
jgi:hypothetical protein